MIRIEFQNKNGHLCPIVICGECLLPITDASQGMVKWRPKSIDSVTPGRNHVRACHKGKCDKASDREEFPFWHELDTFLIYLGNNMKIDWKRAKGKAAMLARI